MLVKEIVKTSNKLVDVGTKIIKNNRTKNIKQKNIKVQYPEK